MATYIILGVVFLGIFSAKTFDVVSGNFGGVEVGRYNNVTTTTYTYANISSVSAQLVARSGSRNYLRCVNNGPKTVFLNLGTTVTKYQAPFELNASDSFELFFNQNPYTGPVAAVTADDVASPSIRFTCSEGNGVLTTY